MSPLTPWHYLLIGVLTLLLLLGTILSLRSSSKYSILTTIVLVLVLIGVFSWKSINENVYLVEVSNLEQKRFYQSEQIMIKGTIRNVGDFPVGNVIATIKLSNTRGDGKGGNSIFSQPSVFAEIYEGDNPKFKRQNIVEEHVVADSLSPGKAKPFRIMMDYPAHFKGASFDVTARAEY